MTGERTRKGWVRIYAVPLERTDGGTWYGLRVENDQGGMNTFGFEPTPEEAERKWAYEVTMIAIGWSGDAGPQRPGRGRKPHAWTDEEEEALRTHTLSQMRERFGIAQSAARKRRSELGIVKKRGRAPSVFGRLRHAGEPVGFGCDGRPDLTGKLIGQLLSAGGRPEVLADELVVSRQRIYQRVARTADRVAAMRGFAVADLRGRRFGRLTAVIDSGRNGTGPGDEPIWLCRCECGRGALAPADALVAGTVRSCDACVVTCRCGGQFWEEEGREFCDGCRDAAEEAIRNLVGRTYVRLKVIAPAASKIGGAAAWICRCKCGKETGPIPSQNLRRHASRSCGCLGDEYHERRKRNKQSPADLMAKRQEYDRRRREAAKQERPESEVGDDRELA